MDLTHYFKRQHPMPGLNGIEKIAAIYIGITLVLTAIFYPDIEEATLFSIISGRVAVIIGTSLLLWLYKRYPCHATYHLRVLFQVALLAYWYPDIYNIAAQMPSQDHILAIADQAIFGCQPSVVFSQTLSGTFWNELFNMGYFSYYLMIAAVVFLAIVKRPRKFDKTTFVLMSTFFMYYTVFLLFNSAGPQFYFSCHGVDVSHGEFPPVDTWFRDHNTLNHMSQQPCRGLNYYTLPDSAHEEKMGCHHVAFLGHTMSLYRLHRCPLCYRRGRRTAICLAVRNNCQQTLRHKSLPSPTRF